MLTAETFLAEIEAFLAHEGISPSAFGRDAVGDPNFVSDLRAGRMPNLRMVGRVQGYIKQQSAA